MSQNEGSAKTFPLKSENWEELTKGYESFSQPSRRVFFLLLRFYGMLLVTLKKFKFKDFQQLFAVFRPFSRFAPFFCCAACVTSQARRSGIMYAKSTIFLYVNFKRQLHYHFVVLLLDRLSLSYNFSLAWTQNVWKCYWKFIRNSLNKKWEYDGESLTFWFELVGSNFIRLFNFFLCSPSSSFDCNHQRFYSLEILSYLYPCYFYVQDSAVAAVRHPNTPHTVPILWRLSYTINFYSLLWFSFVPVLLLIAASTLSEVIRILSKKNRKVHSFSGLVTENLRHFATAFSRLFDTE